ncbi:hypothetical protein GCM10017559_44720 [Streptosporangium longisporum]|uniref:Penicillin-binding protein n=1 Tax=Streptosporangium longisporum TaxID=46187 RepID=A0ABP6KNP5_9ACTN
MPNGGKTPGYQGYGHHERPRDRPSSPPGPGNDRTGRGTTGPGEGRPGRARDEDGDGASGGPPGQRVSDPAQARVARAASSRATGMRNGEQDT